MAWYMAAVEGKGSRVSFVPEVELIVRCPMSPLACYRSQAEWREDRDCIR